MNFTKLVRPTLVGLFACLCTLVAQAQNKTITGKVMDAKDGSPMVGASVVAKGSKSGTQTGADGSFKLSVPTSTSTLIISSVGYAAEEVSIASRSDVSVSLKATNDQLGDVVVIGYGTARKKDLTGSVVSVQAKDFNQGVSSAPELLLQNKVSGLEITNNSGQPGSGTTIKIRGNSSIRASNNPLYVVDGVPLDGGSARPNLAAGFGNSPATSPLLYINPNDIAQIDVLKDASSAAIYGSRGANGVIVITTKKGSAGPVKVEAGSEVSAFAGYMKRYKVLSPAQFRSALTKYGLASSLDGGANVDALKEITQNTLSQNYNVAFSGGNDVGKFRASFLASSGQGFLKKTSLDKYIATFAGSYKFLDKRLTLDFNLIAGNFVQHETSVSNNAGSQGNIISSALSWNPTVSFRNSAGLYNLNSNGIANPLSLNDAFSDVSKTSTFLGNISAAYKLTNELEYKFLYGVNYGTGRRLVNVEGFIVGFSGLSGQGLAAIANQSLTSETFTHTLSYKNKIARNVSLDAIVGYEYWKTNVEGGGLSASGFNTNLDQSNRTSIQYTSIFQNAKTQNPYTTFVNPTVELQSFFARANVNISDKYFLTATMRADGSSRFGANNKYGYFPSVGAKWQINNESFMKNNKTFSNFALRASYGLTGNQEFPSGAALEQFYFSAYNTAGQINVKNPNLKWETTTTFNVGADLSFAKGKINVSLDYYNRNTKDILFQTITIAPAPPANEYINLPANLVNSGVEFAINASVISKPKFGWDLNFNIAYNKNIIKNFAYRILTGTIDGQGVSGTLSQAIANNQPVNEYYLKPFGGFDASGNQIIGSDPTYAGDPNPHVLAGFGTKFRYQKFDLDINTGGAFGFMIYNNTATSVTNISGISTGRNIDLNAYNSAEKPSSGVGASTRFLEKGDYFKLRNVTLSYNLGNTGKYIKNLRAFVRGSNLLVITKFSGFDPEVNIDKASGAYPSRSIEYVPYPTPRTITVGVNFSL